MSHSSSDGFFLFARAILCVALVGGASGCSTLKYLFQAGRGQLELSNRARPIDQVVKDEKTPARLRALLSEVEPVKRYGEERGIRATANYTEFVKLDRKAASWIVSACEPLKFVPKVWKFPIVGSFPYLGWFELDDARQYAAELKAEGLDVDLRGAAAYSTLGWFRDAVLSSMIPEGDEASGELLNVILHESLHATVYVKGQAFFNESLASFVADRLTIAYLKETRGPLSPELSGYLKREEEGKARARALHEAYGALDTLYRSPRADSEKLVEKARILGELKTRLGFAREINNATLIQYKEYNESATNYQALLDACGSDWKKFLSVLGRLGPESFAKSQDEDLNPMILKLAQSGCR